MYLVALRGYTLLGEKDFIPMCVLTHIPHLFLEIQTTSLCTLQSIAEALLWEASELRTRQRKLTQSGESTSKLSKEWGKGEPFVAFLWLKWGEIPCVITPCPEF